MNTKIMKEIEAEVVRTNNFGLVVVKDINSAKQYCFMIDNFNGLTDIDFENGCLPNGFPIFITVNVCDDRVAGVRKR